MVVFWDLLINKRNSERKHIMNMISMGITEVQTGHILEPCQLSQVNTIIITDGPNSGRPIALMVCLNLWSITTRGSFNTQFPDAFLYGNFESFRNVL